MGNRRDLREARESVLKGLRQEDFFRQMIRIERTDFTQLLDHLRRDSLRLPIFRTAMHHAVANGSQSSGFESFLYPIHQQAHRRLVIRHGY
jgi:hypothetical protein